MSVCSNPSTISDRSLAIGARRKRYETLDYSVGDVEESAGAAIALSDDKARVLMGRMRYPSLSIHVVYDLGYIALADTDVVYFAVVIDFDFG